MMVQLGDSAEGVRVDLASGARVAGVSVVDRGKPWLVRDGAGRLWPTVAVGQPESPLSSAEIASQGPDLVVRLAGPPIASISDHPDAPVDPVLTWVRLRHRGDDWRVVVDGLATVSIPVNTPKPTRVDDGQTEIQARTGRLRFGTTASRWSSDWDVATGRWTFSTNPALTAVEPYPRTTLTWSPVR